MTFSERLADWREKLRHRWMYRRGDGSASPSASSSGAAANALGFFQSGPVADTISLAGRAALPLILLTIGAGLNFSALGARPAILSLSVTMRLIFSPVIFYGVFLLFGV